MFKNNKEELKGLKVKLSRKQKILGVANLVGILIITGINLMIFCGFRVLSYIDVYFLVIACISYMNIANSEINHLRTQIMMLETLIDLEESVNSGIDKALDSF